MMKGCNLKRGLGLLDLRILWIVRVGEWLVFEGAAVVADKIVKFMRYLCIHRAVVVRRFTG